MLFIKWMSLVNFFFFLGIDFKRGAHVKSARFSFRKDRNVLGATKILPIKLESDFDARMRVARIPTWGNESSFDLSWRFFFYSTSISKIYASSWSILPIVPEPPWPPGIGMPAGLDIIIWSILNIPIAALVANLMAVSLPTKWSKIPCSTASTNSPP